jgi:hypothetical protein
MSKVSSLIMSVVSPVGTGLLNVGQPIKILGIAVGSGGTRLVILMLFFSSEKQSPVVPR